MHPCRELGGASRRGSSRKVLVRTLMVLLAISVGLHSAQCWASPQSLAQEQERQREEQQARQQEAERQREEQQARQQEAEQQREQQQARQQEAEQQREQQQARQQEAEQQREQQQARQQEAEQQREQQQARQQEAEQQREQQQARQQELKRQQQELQRQREVANQPSYVASPPPTPEERNTRIAPTQVFSGPNVPSTSPQGSIGRAGGGIGEKVSSSPAGTARTSSSAAPNAALLNAMRSISGKTSPAPSPNAPPAKVQRPNPTQQAISDQLRRFAATSPAKASPGAQSAPPQQSLVNLIASPSPSGYALQGGSVTPVVVVPMAPPDRPIDRLLSLIQTEAEPVEVFVSDLQNGSDVTSALLDFISAQPGTPPGNYVLAPACGPPQDCATTANPDPDQTPAPEGAVEPLPAPDPPPPPPPDSDAPPAQPN